MSDQSAVLDMQSESFRETTADSTIDQVERRTRMLLYFFSLFSAGVMLMLLAWMVMSEFTKPS